VDTIAAEIVVAIVEASLRASQITVGTAAADKTLVLAMAVADRIARVTMTTSVVISPATHRPASLAASDRTRMQGIDSRS
jgi:hypothetical protein